MAQTGGAIRLQRWICRATVRWCWRPVTDGDALVAAAELQDDREVVLAAVEQNGGALQYAAAELQGDREVVLAAVSHDGDAAVLCGGGLQERPWGEVARPWRSMATPCGMRRRGCRRP